MARASDSSGSFVFKFWFIRVIRVIRGSYFDFLVPDRLERLRRDRRGSAVAFHAGTIHPQLGFDKEPMKP